MTQTNWGSFVSEPNLDDVCILIAEDDESFKDSLGFFLSSLGAVVEFASDGAEGVSKALAGNYDLVFMDLTLPKMDGETAVKTLRSNSYSKPIIAMSAHSASARKTHCLEIGFTDYITKPFGLDEIIKKIEEHLPKQ